MKGDTRENHSRWPARATNVGINQAECRKFALSTGDWMPLQPPMNVLNLKFSNIQDFNNYWDEFAHLGAMIWKWHEKKGDKDGSVELDGICDICLNECNFSTKTSKSTGDYFNFRAQWADFTCSLCHLSARERHMITHLKENSSSGDTIYHVGHHSLIANYLRDNFEKVVTSQYEEGRARGEVDKNNILYEDLTNLSFSDGIFGTVICSEILEHIPDYKRALREIHRVLRDDGCAIMTFPWLGGKNYDTLVRAELMPDGTIKHYLPPEYHGDPAKNEGILSFRSFGWQILDEMRDVGFKNVYADYKFAPLHGHMTALIPIIIAEK